MTDPGPRERGEGDDGLPVPSPHRVDLVVTALILGLCAFLYWDTTTFAEIPRGLAQNVPPTLFPQLLLLVIAAMALLLPFEHVQKRAQGIDLDEGRRDRIRPITWITALAVLGLVAVMPWLGTFAAMIAACAVLPVLWGERRYWLVAIYALALPFGVAALFAGVLEVNFLPGITGHLFR